MWPKDKYCCSKRARTPSHTVAIRLSRQERIAIAFGATVRENCSYSRGACEVSSDLQDFTHLVKQRPPLGHRIALIFEAKWLLRA
jgi:hypothetical protein